MIYTITLNPAIDRLLYIEGNVIKKKTNRISKIAYDIGGKGLHGSHVLTVLGLANQALAFCGSDNQTQLETLVKNKGIDYQFVSLDSQKTRESYVVIETAGRGSWMMTESGFEVSRPAQEQLLKLISVTVQARDTVLIAGSLPKNYSLKQLKELITLLKSKDCFIACDLSGSALALAVAEKVNFIKPNEFELAELTRSVVGSSPLKRLKQLVEQVDYVVLSQGASGSLCGHDGKLYRVTPPKVKELNDTGAGDCFVGAFIGGLTTELSLTDSLILATACAASQVQQADSTSFDYQEALLLREQVILTEIK